MPQTPEDYFGPMLPVVQQAVRAMYLGDLKALQEVALPDPNLAQALANPPCPPYQREVLDEAIEEMDVRPTESFESYAVGCEYVDLKLHFRGMLYPGAVRRVGEAWKFDCRWWIAAHANDDEPQRVTRAFLLAWMTNNVEELMHSVNTHPQLGVLLRGPGAPQGEWGQLQHVVETALFAPAVIGEDYLTVTGVRQVKAEDVSGDRLMFHVLMAASPPAMPVQLVKTSKGWRVDPSLFIEAMSQQ